MGHAAVPAPMTANEFLAWDATQTIKHEFVRGEVFAMAGAHEAHVRLALNFSVTLLPHLKGSPCRLFMADMKLRVEAATPSTTRTSSSPAARPMPPIR